jgi:hypothetical protein
VNVDRDLVRAVAPPILAACVVALLLEVPGPVLEVPPIASPSATASP